VLSKCIFRYISIAPVQFGGTTLRDGFESDQSYRGDNTDQCLPSRKRKSQACGTALDRLLYYPHDTTVAKLKKRAHQSGTCKPKDAKHSHVLPEALKTSVWQKGEFLSDMKFLASYMSYSTTYSRGLSACQHSRVERDLDQLSARLCGSTQVPRHLLVPCVCTIYPQARCATGTDEHMSVCQS
jgi:hypothetical protein